jgi:plasmid stabilization system protein ParE
MAVDLIIASEVQRDINEAYSWYEKRRLGLGEEFLSCLEACIQVIIRTPEICEKAHEEYRRALLRRFPYAIFYDYLNERITIYSVFHTAMDPKKWYSRLN